MSYISKQILNTNININSNELIKDIDGLILHKLKEKYENICTQHGYILGDSINLINRELGNIKTIDNNSYISYVVNYTADIIYPTEGEIIEVIVDRVNKMGVISYINNSKNDFENSPLIVIIPNEYFTDSTRDINSITKNQKIKVEILSIRIKYGNSKIQIVAKPL